MPGPDMGGQSCWAAGSAWRGAPGGVAGHGPHRGLTLLPLEQWRGLGEVFWGWGSELKCFPLHFIELGRAEKSKAGAGSGCRWQCRQEMRGQDTWSSHWLTGVTSTLTMRSFGPDPSQRTLRTPPC